MVLDDVDMYPHELPRPPTSFERGFSLLEVLTALTIFSSSYMALMSAHFYISNYTQKQIRELHTISEQSNQYEINVALVNVEEEE